MKSEWVAGFVSESMAGFIGIRILDRYQCDILPTKRGFVQEIQRIDVLRRHELAYRTLIGLSQQDIASFRDERPQSVAPSTTARGLAILSHVLEVAICGRGLPVAKNVVTWFVVRRSEMIAP